MSPSARSKCPTSTAAWARRVFSVQPDRFPKIAWSAAAARKGRQSTVLPAPDEKNQPKAPKKRRFGSFAAAGKGTRRRSGGISLIRRHTLKRRRPCICI